MLPAWIRSRQVFLGIFLATALMMGFGYWLQYAEGLEPCPLCMTQRIFITLAGWPDERSASLSTASQNAARE